MHESAALPILIVGGSGYFGRLLAADLLAHTSHSITLAGRRGDALELARTILVQDAAGDARRISTSTCSLDDQTSVRSIVSGCALAVCAAGPFQRLPLSLLDACLEQGKPYLDLSDDREFVRRVVNRVEGRGAGASLPPVFTAWSAVSALSCALARIGSPGWSRRDVMRIQIAPGNRQPRNRGTVASLLSSLGRPFEIRGKPRRVTGWSKARKFDFPEPVGRREGYLIEVPDYDLAVRWLGAQTVEFRVGAESGWLNAAASLIAFKRSVGALPDLTPLTGLFCAVMGLLGSFGTDSGAVGIELEGLDAHGSQVRSRVSVVAEHGGPGIAVLPAAIVADRFARESAGHLGGLVRHDDWITRRHLEDECARRHFRLVVE